MSLDDLKNNAKEERTRQPNIPQEAEYGYYSTGPVNPNAKKRTGLFVLMTLLVILLCAFVSLLMSLKFQLSQSDGRIALYVSDAGDSPKEDNEQDAQAGEKNDGQTHADKDADSAIVIPAPEGTQTDDVSVAITTTEGQELSLQEIYQKVIPSVVSIINQTYSGEVTGTGIVMSADGYIITNYHVISESASLEVLLQDDTTYQATLIGSDETSDLAVLKIDATGLTPAEFGDSDTLQVGDQVVAIGDPLGTQLRGTMTDGIISAINRDLTYDGRSMTLLQTNAALNSGNSGGPLVNMSGQVIGINTMKVSSSYTTADVEGLGFAIPISIAKEIVDELLQKGYVAGRPAIGITAESVPMTAQAYYRLPAGVYVQSVNESSDAYQKGIRSGDIITSINDTQVSSVEDLNTVKGQFQAGDSVTLIIYRGGKYYQVDVTLMDASGVMQ